MVDQRQRVPLIGWTLVLGATIFAAIATALPYLSPQEFPESAPDTSTLNILSVVHLMLFVQLMLVERIVTKTLRAKPEGKANAQIVRWAMHEGAALFGCVVVLLGGLSGALPDQPAYYVNFVSLVWFWIVVTRDNAAHVDLVL